MTDMLNLLNTVEQLSDDEMLQLYVYIVTNHKNTIEAKIATIPSTARIAGLFPGIWVSDDFDDELPDSFWFGNDA